MMRSTNCQFPLSGSDLHTFALMFSQAIDVVLVIRQLQKPASCRKHQHSAVCPTNPDTAVGIDLVPLAQPALACLDFKYDFRLTIHEDRVTYRKPFVLLSTSRFLSLLPFFKELGI